MEEIGNMEIACHWRMNKQRYTLSGSKCECCGQASLNLRPFCTECLAKEPAAQPEQAAHAQSQPDTINFSDR
jgi:uncharacterized OB-fold protein